jgi:tetratricopeptide (TPR) repeat protein
VTAIHAFGLGLLALLALAPSSHAQMFKDSDLDSLHRIEHPAERQSALTKRAQERLARQADDPQALLALALVAVNDRDAGQLERAQTALTGCIERLPRAAECHYGFAIVRGTHALQQGMLKAMSSAGRIRDAFAQAVALEPLWFPARSGWVEYLLQAPSVVGGGVGKAREAARAVAPQRPDQAAVLDARVALHEKDVDTALKLLANGPLSQDIDVARAARDLRVSAGFSLLNDGQAEKARPLFERVMREQPELALGPYGLGRVATDQGQGAEAVALLTKSAKLQGAEQLPVDYRLALALLVQGQRDAARAALQRFVATKGPWSSKTVEEARKKLQDLG